MLHRNARSLFLATVFLCLVAFAPLICAWIGYAWASAWGCIIDPAAPPYAECAQPNRELAVMSLIDMGFYFPFTILIAGVPALYIGTLACIAGIQALKLRS